MTDTIALFGTLILRPHEVYLKRFLYPLLAPLIDKKTNDNRNFYARALIFSKSHTFVHSNGNLNLVAIRQLT